MNGTPNEGQKWLTLFCLWSITSVCCPPLSIIPCAPKPDRAATNCTCPLHSWSWCRPGTAQRRRNCRGVPMRRPTPLWSAGFWDGNPMRSVNHTKSISKTLTVDLGGPWTSQVAKPCLLIGAVASEKADRALCILLYGDGVDFQVYISATCNKWIYYIRNLTTMSHMVGALTGRL